MVLVAVPVAMGSHLSSIVGGLVSDVVVLCVLVVLYKYFAIAAAVCQSLKPLAFSILSFSLV